MKYIQRATQLNALNVRIYCKKNFDSTFVNFIVKNINVSILEDKNVNYNYFQFQSMLNDAIQSFLSKIVSQMYGFWYWWWWNLKEECFRRRMILMLKYSSCHEIEFFFFASTTFSRSFKLNRFMIRYMQSKFKSFLEIPFWTNSRPEKWIPF